LLIFLATNTNEWRWGTSAGCLWGMEVR
jgi:hypothetical protein